MILIGSEGSKRKLMFRVCTFEGFSATPRGLASYLVSVSNASAAPCTFGAGSCLQIPTGLGGSLGSVLPGFDKIRVIESILGKPLQGAVGASGLGGSCNGISEMAILGLAAVLPKCLRLVLNAVACYQF